MRHAESNSFGKCDCEIKVCLDEQTYDDLIMLAGLKKMSKSEYIRNVLHLHVFGHSEVSRMQANK